MSREAKNGDVSIFPLARPKGKNRNVPIFLVVLVTCPNKAVARRLANALVTKRLAACVNVLPGIESTFQWKGKIDRCREVLLLIKTTSKHFGSLAREIKRLHPYEVPEIIALPVTAGSAPYVRWVVSCVA